MDIKLMTATHFALNNGTYVLCIYSFTQHEVRIKMLHLVSLSLPVCKYSLAKFAQ